MGSLDWKKLIEERNVWVAYNFPNPSVPNPGESIMGCMEELGELTHAHLKQAQSIRGSSEKHQAAAKDAIGDLSVYLMGVMSFYGVTPVDLDLTMASVGGYTCLLRLAGVLGKGAEATLILSYTGAKAKWGECTAALVFWMRRYCYACRWDYNLIVQETWDHVKKRDWIKYPETGMPPVDLHMNDISHLWEEDKPVGADGK